MNREKESYPMIEVEEAIERFLSHFRLLEAETVPVLETLDDLKLYFMGISTELSQYLGVDYTGMVDHSHNQT